MKFGISMFPTDYAIPAHELARATEDLGFDTLFFPEHTHIPTSRRTPWPGGAPLPLEYSHTLDPFVALGAAAVVTSRLLLGTGICLVIERDPITLAKEVASVDHISNGRLLFGIGGGWNVEEMANHGTRYPVRWKLLRERMLAMKEIWTKDEAEYHGELVDFDPIWSWPKPVQKPHPPIWIGGDGARTFERVIEYGDAWMPIGRGDPVALTEKLADLQQRSKAAGRAPIPATVFGAPAKPELVELYAKAGFEGIVFSLPPAPAAESLPRLQRYAEVARAFGP